MFYAISCCIFLMYWSKGEFHQTNDFGMNRSSSKIDRITNVILSYQIERALF